MYPADRGRTGTVQSDGELYVWGGGVSDGGERDSAYARWFYGREEGARTQLNGLRVVG
jgi:hypothetical protein